MYLVELLFGADVKKNRFSARFDVGNQLIDADKLRRDIGRQSLLGKLGILRRIGIGRWGNQEYQSQRDRGAPTTIILPDAVRFMVFLPGRHICSFALTYPRIGRRWYAVR